METEMYAINQTGPDGMQSYGETHMGRRESLHELAGIAQAMVVAAVANGVNRVAVQDRHEQLLRTAKGYLEASNPPAHGTAFSLDLGGRGGYLIIRYLGRMGDIKR